MSAALWSPLLDFLLWRHSPGLPPWGSASALNGCLASPKFCWRWSYALGSVRGDSPASSFGVLGSLFFLPLIPDCSSGSFSLQATRHLAPPCFVPGRLTL